MADSDQATFMDENITHLLRSLPMGILCLCVNFLAHFAASECGVLFVGTLCSGTELGFVTAQTLLDGFARQGAKVPRLYHAFACENNRRKIRWLKNNFKPKKIFTDIKCMGCDTARCCLSGADEIIDTVSLCMCGFSCKDLSRLSINCSASGTWVTDMSGFAIQKTAICPKVLVVGFGCRGRGGRGGPTSVGFYSHFGSVPRIKKCELSTDCLPVLVPSNNS